jgi:hypothetical protein
MTLRSRRRASTTKAATFHTSAYDLLAAGDLEGENVRFAYIGGPTALIEIGERRLLTDPTFDPPGKRYFMGWGTISRKVQGPALTVDQLGKVDAVLVSHFHHSNNLDDAGRKLLSGIGTVITTTRLGRGGSTPAHGASHRGRPPGSKHPASRPWRSPPRRAAMASPAPNRSSAT